MKTPTIESIEQEIEKRTLEESLLDYTKWSFKNIYGGAKEFIVNSHHKTICDYLEKVYRGEIQNLIINIAPRYSKTLIAVKSFTEWAMAKTMGRCKFIHLSYSDMLALDNSSQIMEDMSSDWYQSHWPIQNKKNKDSKGSWETTSGGAFYATGTMGSVTGFGAGEMDSKVFSGSIIIDDAMKPEEAYSDSQRSKINERLVHTIMSRRNDPKTPIIIIMQRLHEDDMTGYCLQGKTGEEWIHLSIPAINEDGTALWAEKHSIEKLKEMQKASPGVFAGQYMQNPVAGSGNMFVSEMFEFGPIPQEQDCSYITADTAYKDKQENDCTAMIAAKIKDNQIYIEKIYNKRIKASDAEREVIGFVNSFAAYGFRGAYIEPKGHGIFLNQILQGKVPMPTDSDIEEFFKDRKLNKVERANNVLPYMSGRKIIVNENIEGIETIINQIISFPRAKHDDVVDCLIDLIKLVYCKEVTIFDAL